MKRQPVTLIILGLIIMFVPFAVHGLAYQIISWIAPGDPNPQGAMVYYGLIWLGSWIVFPIFSIILLVLGFRGLRMADKEERERLIQDSQIQE